MKKIITGAIFTLALLLSATDINAQSFSGSIGNGTITRGGSSRGTIVMDIPGGLHVNSNRPNSEYAIATVVRVSGTGAKIGGISYPRGKSRRFQFSEDAINVYEGRTVFNFNVNVPANFKGNTVKVRAVVRYQACTDEVCYPPKNKEITLTATVR
ncbi:MAG: protein-disulfide reductase DsbD N-terminal domain-containing protein [Acidobacteriota bacterium]|nr:protein-disulfide reductase DsbD N-terminal domain-containing protein [Acidobacteriota bacterium]